ncbi:hypothetical protein GOP47_0030570 [Adiantum capillus-veneris]|nr:hypothetical protein GOP47_0030570 [Adiantum capillus-veneris]
MDATSCESHEHVKEDAEGSEASQNLQGLSTRRRKTREKVSHALQELSAARAESRGGVESACEHDLGRAIGAHEKWRDLRDPFREGDEAARMYLQ